MNCFLGRRDGFWECDTCSAVRLESPEAVIKKMVYVLANPVAAGLVRRAQQWPGLWSSPSLIDPPIVAERPAGFFRKLGRMPASATLQLERPPGFETDAAFAERLSEKLREAEDRAATELEADARSFLGAPRVLAQKPYARPAPGEPRRELNPRVACRTRWKRIETLQRLEEFGWAYQAALESWRAGVRDVIFPLGTWLMRVQHAARSQAYG
ncbi:hypothetical protein [Anaeromyxobacter oryzisoli]|uniref:hypothetical protein n=1 Tax=Anaeromyxobacter oryzisoli TaxID=2925408 RepID=UPI001F57ECD8|nr:hypothetical protein [Anaeromyxobacter sp. SG63]